MANMDLALELVLVVLLGLTLVHAIRLERALRTVRNDRAALGEAIAGFDSSARQAELGIGRMQAIASEAAELIGKRVDKASALKDDLAFMTDRGEALADRLEQLVRAGKAIVPPAGLQAAPEIRARAPQQPEPPTKVRSQAERDLLLALRSAQ
ncbi:MAG: hypothetical protein JOZ05_22550 [Acetobacteraceae bacterium]|nr:hypothetical protein [Acetobacteraceae bacterium]